MLSVTKIFRTTDAQIDLIMHDPLFFNKLHLPHTRGKPCSNFLHCNIVIMSRYSTPNIACNKI